MFIKFNTILFLFSFSILSLADQTVVECVGVPSGDAEAIENVRAGEQCVSFAGRSVKYYGVGDDFASAWEDAQNACKKMYRGGGCSIQICEEYTGPSIINKDQFEAVCTCKMYDPFNMQSSYACFSFANAVGITGTNISMMIEQAVNQCRSKRSNAPAPVIEMVPVCQYSGGIGTFGNP